MVLVWHSLCCKFRTCLCLNLRVVHTVYIAFIHLCQKISVYCISFVFNTSLSLCYVPIAQDPLHLSRDLMARTVDFSRLWHSYTSYMCSAVFHPMYHFLQFILICHFPSHLSCHWSFLVVKRGISLLILFFSFHQVFVGLWKEVHKAFRSAL